MDLRSADLKPLPRCFASIAMQIPEEAVAKLRAVDMTRAMVMVKPRGGQVSPPMPLAGFIQDFAQECADELGTGGPMLATVEPNDGLLERFCFGFIAPGEVSKAPRESAQIQALQAELRGLSQRLEEAHKLMLLGMGGGSSAGLKDRLEEMKMLGDVMRGMLPAQPAAAPAGAGFKDMAEAFTAMVGAAKNMQESATVLAKPAERTIAQEVREIMTIPGAPELTREIADRVLPPRRAGGAAPAQPRGNPLERVA